MTPAHADPARPRRADVAASYDRGAAAYEALWSPVILPPAAALAASLGLTGRCVVADVGAGTGALLGARRLACGATGELRPERLIRTRMPALPARARSQAFARGPAGDLPAA